MSTLTIIFTSHCLTLRQRVKIILNNTTEIRKMNICPIICNPYDYTRTVLFADDASRVDRLRMMVLLDRVLLSSYKDND